MTGRCSYCHTKTMALPGARNRMSRPRPPEGFRIGYVVETASNAWLVCGGCLNRALIGAMA